MRDRNPVPCSILDLFFDTHPFSSSIGSKEDSEMQLQGPLNETLFVSVEHFRATWAFKICIIVMNRTQFPRLCIPEGALFYELVCTCSRIFPLILHHWACRNWYYRSPAIDSLVYLWRNLLNFSPKLLFNSIPIIKQKLLDYQNKKGLLV